jgi:hypothetical protein
MWTFIDNWSWCNAYKNRYGFIQLDLDAARTIKKSGEWFAATALNNSFEKSNDDDRTRRSRNGNYRQCRTVPQPVL